MSIPCGNTSQLNGVWGSSGSDVFAVDISGGGANFNGTAILHYGEIDTDGDSIPDVVQQFTGIANKPVPGLGQIYIALTFWAGKNIQEFFADGHVHHLP